MEPSAIEDIHAAIESSNPFQTLAIVREQDIWQGEFYDLETFNLHASDAVFQAIEQVRADTSGLDKINSLVITGGKGAGKSHIIGRIRRHCQKNGTALFVYAGVEKYSLNFINCEFRKTLAESFDRLGSEGVTQWQEIATFIANQVWQSGNPHAQIIRPHKLIANLHDPAQPQYKLDRWVKLMTTKFECISREKKIDPNLVRAIFWTLSRERGFDAVKWLSGQELPADKSEQMDLPSSTVASQAPESKAFDDLKQILNLASEYKPVLICFDELDTPDTKCSETGLEITHIVARSIKTLIDSISLSTTSQGIAILTVMMPETWMQKIKQMPGGVADRISAKGNPIHLNLMDANSIIDLVILWMSHFYQEKNLTAPTKIYPFEAVYLRSWGNSNSPRRILKECAANFKIPRLISVEDAYNQELELLEHSSSTWLEDKVKLASALYFSFLTLKGKAIDEFEIDYLEKPVKPQTDNSGYIDFKIIGKQNGKPIKIGVSVLQSSQPKAILAAMSRIIAYQTFDMTRCCLLRSKKINQTSAKVQEYLKKFLSPQFGGIWVPLTAEDIKPLLAILYVYLNRKDSKLELERILDFIENRRLVIDNYIVNDILSEPNNSIPEILTDD
jgi:hypothetical protein